MNIVHFAMRRPIAIMVAIVSLLLVSVLAIKQMQRDIFPDLGEPEIYIAQPYGGLDPTQIQRFVTTYYEKNFRYVTGVKSMERKSIQGLSLIKLKFRPETNMAMAISEVISYSERARSYMPPGTVPPYIIRFDAGGVPIGDLVFSSPGRPLGQLQDLVSERVEPLFAHLKGLSIATPFGASQRAIVINIDPEKLRAVGMSPDDVVTAINNANVVVPAGAANIGGRLQMVPTNATVQDIQDLEAVPLKEGHFRTVFLHDVGTVEDSSDIQTGYALVNGHRTIYVPVIKRSDASTLAVVNLIKANLPKFQSLLPDDVKVSYQFDQSPYVTNAIGEVTVETILGALLTGVMVLAFLRDFRSTLIVVLTIPIALLSACAALWIFGQTINMMTLGGLALAVGILVDEATVVIENIHTHLARGKSLPRAALDGAAEVNLATLLSMLCILAVFVPSFFMQGAPRALFVPLSLAVGFSMIASYLAASTFVPIFAVWIGVSHFTHKPSTNPLAFDNLRESYRRLILKLSPWRWLVALVYLGVSLGAIALVGPRIGVDIFPQVDSGQFQIHLTAPPGTSINQTEAIVLKTVKTIKRVVGPTNVTGSLAYVGLQPPSYPINNIYVGTHGPEDAVLQVQISKKTHITIETLKEKLRSMLAQQFPGVAFSFEPSDVVSRVMAFGSPTPVDVLITGLDLFTDYTYARKVMAALRTIPALRDLHFAQTLDYPAIGVAINRQRAGILGYSVRRIARSVVEATSSSRYLTPIFWSDPKTQAGYRVQIQVPGHKIANIADLKNTPIGSVNGSQMLLRNVAKIAPESVVEEFDQQNMESLVSINANIAGSDLGSVSRQMTRALATLPQPPRGVTLEVAGQVTTLHSILVGLAGGLIIAILAIFLLLCANFESPLLALTVLSTIPFVLMGVVVTLWATGTTLNIQSFMGAIMSVGIAVANAIMLVTFAERSRGGGLKAAEAAAEGCRTRLRPILMTSFAMIAGMIPMALGIGEGGQQAAPLGRAVIGGLAGATFATLFVLPAIFVIIQNHRTTRSPSLDPDDPNGRFTEGSNVGTALV